MEGKDNGRKAKGHRPACIFYPLDPDMLVTLLLRVAVDAWVSMDISMCGYET